MSYFLLSNPGPKGSHYLSRKWSNTPRLTPRPKGSYFFLVLLCVCFLCSCKSYYRGLQPGKGDINCIQAFTPQFTNTLYSAIIDVTKHHFSGILLFKLMPDSSTRIVFTNEMGVKFFDFAFTKDGQFIKYYVLHKMDKKVVVNALRKDLELALLHPDLTGATLLTNDTNNYITLPDKSGHDYYITDTHCENLLRIEKSSKRKPVVVVQLLDCVNGIPDSIDVAHKNFKFHIALKRVER